MPLERILNSPRSSPNFAGSNYRHPSKTITQPLRLILRLWHRKDLAMIVRTMMWLSQIFGLFLLGLENSFVFMTNCVQRHTTWMRLVGNFWEVSYALSNPRLVFIFHCLEKDEKRCHYLPPVGEDEKMLNFRDQILVCMLELGISYLSEIFMTGFS